MVHLLRTFSAADQATYVGLVFLATGATYIEQRNEHTQHLLEFISCFGLFVKFHGKRNAENHQPCPLKLTLLEAKAFKFLLRSHPY